MLLVGPPEVLGCLVVEVGIIGVVVVVHPDIRGPVDDLHHVVFAVPVPGTAVGGIPLRETVNDSLVVKVPHYDVVRTIDAQRQSVEGCIRRGAHYGGVARHIEENRCPLLLGCTVSGFLLPTLGLPVPPPGGRIVCLKVCIERVAGARSVLVAGERISGIVGVAEQFTVDADDLGIVTGCGEGRFEFCPG